MYEPKHEWILVERTVGRRTDGGILLPDTVGEAHARVVAVGPGKYSPNVVLRPMSVKIGDLIIIPAGTSAIEVPYRGQTLVAVRDENVLAVIPPEDAQADVVKLASEIPPTERPS
mgnify:FL=1